MQTPVHSKHHLQSLDGIRGIAAMYVLIHHARLMFTQSYANGLAKHPEQYDWYDKLMVYFFSFFKFGHEAVIVFFVLSGFVIHLRQTRPAYSFHDFNIRNYLLKRFIRIYPTLIVSLLLCIGLDYLSVLFRAESNAVFEKYKTINLLYDLLLIADTPTWGYNYPIWSLKHEWFFYLLYPILLWTASYQKMIPLLIATLSYVAYNLGFCIPYVGAAAYTLLIWMLGAFLATCYSNHPQTMKLAPVLLLLVFVYPLIPAGNEYYPFTDLCFGLIMTGFLALLLKAKPPKISRILGSFSFLGAFSYSIYLLHTPVFNFLQSIMQAEERPYHLWYVMLAITITIPAIYIIYYITERPALKLKRLIT